MAGQKSPKSKDDINKKRKRDNVDADTKSKRHRRQPHEDRVNGQNRKQSQKTSKSGTVLKVSEQLGTNIRQEASGYRPQEVIRQTDDGESGWKVSKPMGGRMLDIDPILTEDDQHLILTYNTSIQVYTAVDSLLLRRIPISTLDTTAPKGSKPAAIVATRLSAKDSDFVWVACSDGRIFFVNWKQGSETLEYFQTASKTAKALTVLSSKSESKDEDVLLIIESDKSNRVDVVAYPGTIQSDPSSKTILSLKKPGNGLQLLEASRDGRVLLGALNDRIFLGVATHKKQDAFDQIQYEFISFDVPDLVTSLDLRVYSRPFSAGSGGNKSRGEVEKVVDVLAGSARGSIYFYQDLLSPSQANTKSSSLKDNIQPQKYHWHRKAVHSVKWSRDGNYMISGGSENTLVLWQMDTGRKDFLPHLSGIVENVVVSASGSSYVVHLDDNSAMILSTAEMKPTAYISGIQSAAVDVSIPKDMLVQRAWTSADQVRRPIPAAIRPTDPSKLHVCVGNGRQATMSGDLSAPLLQSFDLETFTNTAKQALARTQPTESNITSKGYTIDEPLVTNIAFSSDGKWLASVDDWVPSARDVESISSDMRDQFIRERREVYLKFWEIRDNVESLALVSRINSPHATSQPEDVLDVASDPTSTCFATIGGDGIVRLWRPKSRQQDGIANKGSDGQDTVSWSCSQVIAVGDGIGQQALVDVSNTSNTRRAQGSVTFSEDGSTIFAAFGNLETGAVYIIDAASGQIAKTIEGLWHGNLQSVRTLSQFVIVLSDELRVYDVVSDELRYGITIPPVPGVKDLLQLAVDHSSGHFAVTLPIGDFSSVGVFDPEDPEPLLVRSTPHRIVSLISVPDASGFLALDDAAQIWVVAESSKASSFAIAQPLQDLQLDIVAEEDEAINGVVPIDADDMDVASDEEADENEEQDGEKSDVEMDDDDAYPSIVAQEHLADIFDAAPAFAAPSIEDMFYRVTGLIASKPLSAASA